MANERRTGMRRYRLLHVHGCTEPELLPAEAKSWRGLEKMLIEFLKTDQYEEEDALFYVVTGLKGKLRDVSAFVSHFMDEMWERAGKKAPWA